MLRAQLQTGDFLYSPAHFAVQAILKLTQSVYFGHDRPEDSDYGRRKSLAIGKDLPAVSSHAHRHPN
jgi:hypothetical protein